MSPKNTRVMGLLFLSLITVAFLAYGVGASDVQEFLSDGVTQITVTMTPTESSADFVIDTSETSFDSQSVDIQNKTVGAVVLNKVAFSFNISDFLKDINFGINFHNGSAPQFNNLDVVDSGFTIHLTNVTIDGISSIPANAVLNEGTKSFLQIILGKLNLSIDDRDGINTYLTDHPQSTSSDRDYVFTKTGSQYKVSDSGGLGSTVPSNWNSIVNDKIEESVESASIQSIFSKITPFLGDSLDSSFFDGLGLNYTVQDVNLTGVSPRDGTYTVPVTINDGAIPFTININLVLQGVVNEDTQNTDVNGVYTPADTEVSRYVLGVSGLVNGISVTASVFDVFSSTLPSNTNKVLKYMEISGPGAVPGTVQFKIPTGEISNPSLVSLYVFETGTSTWTKLPTTFLGESGGFYEFSATTPHFSTFMVMQSLATTSSGGGSSRSSDNPQFGGVVNATANPTQATPTPIVATPGAEPKQGFFASITGAVVGALGAGGTTVVIVFIVAIAGLVVVFRANRASSGKKGKRLNEEGDKDGA